MGFKIENIQSPIHNHSLPSMSTRVIPKDDISHNYLNSDKNIPVKTENYEEAKVDLKSSNPVIFLLRKMISAIAGK